MVASCKVFLLEGRRFLLCLRMVRKRKALSFPISNTNPVGSKAVKNVHTSGSKAIPGAISCSNQLERVITAVILYLLYVATDIIKDEFLLSKNADREMIEMALEGFRVNPGLIRRIDKKKLKKIIYGRLRQLLRLHLLYIERTESSTSAAPSSTGLPKNEVMTDKPARKSET